MRTRYTVHFLYQQYRKLTNNHQSLHQVENRYIRWPVSKHHNLEAKPKFRAIHIFSWGGDCFTYRTTGGEPARNRICKTCLLLPFIMLYSSLLLLIYWREHRRAHLRIPPPKRYVFAIRPISGNGSVGQLPPACLSSSDTSAGDPPDCLWMGPLAFNSVDG